MQLLNHHQARGCRARLLLSTLLVLVSFALGIAPASAQTAIATAAEHPAGRIAPKPLFRDPVHDGAADPTFIWNVARKQWWVFYTNRRADLPTTDPKDVSWLHGTRIGIATSDDKGATWHYHGEANLPSAHHSFHDKTQYTQWAPEIVYVGTTYHMYLTIVPGIFHDWNAPRHIIHLTSPDLEHWRFISQLNLGSDRVIDPCVFQLPSGNWRMWYKDEQDDSHIHIADSKDLATWTPKGAVIIDRSSEGPNVFRWHDRFWMTVDAWHGLGVYRSDDLTHWTRQPDNLLEAPGHIATDRSQGHHPDVIISNDRAFLFYFTHQEKADDRPDVPYSARRTVLQVTELSERNGTLTADRDSPTWIDLEPPDSSSESR